MQTERLSPTTPLHYATVLADLKPAHWPPDEVDLQELALACALLIFEIDRWESKTHGQDVIDTVRGAISTAEARRILAREVSVSVEGDTTIMLVPAGEQRVYVEMRATTDNVTTVLRRPEIVLSWFHDGAEYEHHYRLEDKGPQWYMLSQLRDDLLEQRLTQR